MRGFEVAGRWPPATRGRRSSADELAGGALHRCARLPTGASASAASANESERYNFEGLIARLSKAKAREPRRRVLITSVRTQSTRPDMAKGLGRMLSRNGRHLVSLDRSPARRQGEPGLRILLAAMPLQRHHRTGIGAAAPYGAIGTLDVAVLHKEQSALGSPSRRSTRL